MFLWLLHVGKDEIILRHASYCPLNTGMEVFFWVQIDLNTSTIVQEFYSRSKTLGRWLVTVITLLIMLPFSVYPKKQN